MLKFRQTTIKINGAERRKGYRVIGLDARIFRGLQVVVVKCRFGRREWYAYEATTGRSLMPRSWAGGQSHKTRAGIIQIVANALSNAPESLWTRIQQELDYDLVA